MATKRPRKTTATATRRKLGAAQRSGKSVPANAARPSPGKSGKAPPKKPASGATIKKAAVRPQSVPAQSAPPPPRRPTLRDDAPGAKSQPVLPRRSGAARQSVESRLPGAKEAAGGGPGKVVPGGKPAATATRRLPRGELSRIRELLDRKRRALKDHIQAELTELETPEKKHRTDLEEIASDTHDTDSLCEIMGMESIQIDQIERAIRQIDDGTYGVCEDCGGEIPLVRLEALPFATQCVDCKRRAEIAGQISAASGG